MPIYSPTGFLDVTNATLRTSNIEAENFKLNGGNIYVSTDFTVAPTLQLITNGGSVTSNTVQFSNVTTGLVADSNIVVTGNVTAGYLHGDASNVTAVPAAQVTGTLVVANGGTGTTTSTGTGSVVLSDAPTFTGDVTFDTNTLFVDSVNDRVGVGTTSPGAKMDIYTGSTGTVGLSFDRFASGNYRTDIYQNTYGLDFRVGYAENTPESVLYLKRFSDGSKEVEINGNVGIGTTTPGDKLHLYGATDSILRVETDTGQAQLLLRSGASTRRACRIDFSRADTGTQYMQLIGDYQQNGTDDLTVATSTSGRIMTWLQNGNVGIGTNSPSQKFVVMGDSAIIHSNSADTHNTNDRTLYIGGREVNGSLNQSKCAIVSTPSTSHGGAGQYGRNALHFCVGPDAQNNTNASKADSRMCIDYTGNVGVGTTNPQQNLHVHEAGSGQVVIAVTNDTTGSGNNDGIHFGIDSGENGFVWHKPNTQLKFATDNTERMRVDSGTTVTVAGGTAGKGVSFAHAGIAIDRVWSNYPSITVMNQNSTGDTNQSQLRVHGCNVSYSSYPNTSGSDFGCSIYIDGTYQTSSDRRFKTNITTIDNALDKVLSLSGKRYQLLNVDGNIRTNVSTNDYKYGFIAQDLQELGLDETYIHYSEEDDGTDGYNKSYSVDYDSFIPLLVNAIKEQTVIINNIKDQLELERDRNDDLEARILALENAS